MQENRVVEEALRLYNARGFTPFLKEDLKFKIKKRRKSEKKEDIIVDLKPKIPEGPSAEDLAMQADRRNRNNEAARKYRKKLRGHQTKIQSAHNKLIKERLELEQEIVQLRKAKQELVDILSRFPKNCCQYGARVQSDSLTKYSNEPYNGFMDTSFITRVCYGLGLGRRQNFNDLSLPRRSQHRDQFQPYPNVRRHLSMSSTGSSSPSQPESPNEDSLPYIPHYTSL